MPPDLSKIDLNLLVLLDVLLRTQSVKQAAEALNLTPSAVSHALRRLRVVFGDELLVRDGRRMVPTARADALAAALPDVLSRTAQLFTPPAPFDPANSNRVFRLLAPDFVTPLVVRLLHQMARIAPHVGVELLPFTPATTSDMKNGQFDAMIGPAGVDDSTLRATPIGRWSWVVYARPGHPAFSHWSLEAWAAFPHLLVRTSGPAHPGPIDRIAQAHGVTRRVGATLPHFAAAAAALAQTDMLLTVPTVTMQPMTGLLSLEHRPVPFDIPPLELALFHHAVTGAGPEAQWFRAQVASASAALGP